MPHEGANLTEEKIMELKNCKIGIQLDDAQLQLHLAELLMRKGAFVYTARNDEEMDGRSITCRPRARRSPLRMRGRWPMRWCKDWQRWRTNKRRDGCGES